MKKAYTDIEQSRKLAEILPIESSDMFYRDNGIDVKLMWEHNAHNVKYPCWSLAALLEVLPHHIDDRYDLVLGKLSDNIGWYVMYDDIDHFVFLYIAKSDLIDACYEMILKLKEKNLLRITGNNIFKN